MMERSVLLLLDLPGHQVRRVALRPEREEKHEPPDLSGDRWGSRVVADLVCAEDDESRSRN